MVGSYILVHYKVCNEFDGKENLLVPKFNNL